MVLTIDELRQVLGQVRDLRVRMCLTVIYSCGVRLTEGSGLLTADVDSGRMVVRVRAGKGGRDRYVPLSTARLTCRCFALAFSWPSPDPLLRHRIALIHRSCQP